MKTSYGPKAHCPIPKAVWIPLWTCKCLALCVALLMAQSARAQVNRPRQPLLTNQPSPRIAPLPGKAARASAAGQWLPREQRVLDKTGALQGGEKRPASGLAGGTLAASEQRVFDKSGALQAGEKRPATAPAGGTLPASEQRVFDKTEALQAGEKRPAIGPAGGTLPASEQRSFDKSTPGNQ
jgi:hypothetical protein